MKQEEPNNKISQIIARCWSDDNFKKKLLANPVETLKAEGVTVPEGASVKVLEDTGTVLHLVVPAKPTDLSDNDLDKVAGGNNLEIGFHPMLPGEAINAGVYRDSKLL